MANLLQDSYALAALTRSAVLHDLLGEPLVALYAALKHHEGTERAACVAGPRHWDVMHLTELA